MLRDADYCSAACIMIPRELFQQLQGFDPLYAPAYYEDGDLAFRVRQLGRAWTDTSHARPSFTTKAGPPGPMCPKERNDSRS